MLRPALDGEFSARTQLYPPTPSLICLDGLGQGMKLLDSDELGERNFDPPQDRLILSSHSLDYQRDPFNCSKEEPDPTPAYLDLHLQIVRCQT